MLDTAYNFVQRKRVCPHRVCANKVTASFLRKYAKYNGKRVKTYRTLLMNLTNSLEQRPS
jgi:hypothetical protein